MEVDTLSLGTVKHHPSRFPVGRSAQSTLVERRLYSTLLSTQDSTLLWLSADLELISKLPDQMRSRRSRSQPPAGRTRRRGPEVCGEEGRL